MRTENFTLPAHWANAIINGDLTGLTDADESQLGEFESELVELYGTANLTIISDDEQFFSWAHDAYHILPVGCYCLEYTLLY